MVLPWVNQTAWTPGVLQKIKTNHTASFHTNYDAYDDIVIISKCISEEQHNKYPSNMYQKI